MAILRAQRVLGNKFCRPNCIWAPRGTTEYLNGPQQYPAGVQIHFGLQNLLLSTLWALKMAIFGAFVKIEMPTIVGCYNLF